MADTENDRNAKNEEMEKQLSQLDKIVKSIDELLIVTNDREDLDEKTRETLQEIMNFLSKVLIILPDVLLDTKEHEFVSRSDLIKHFQMVKETWKDESIKYKYFIERWCDFKDYWKKFFETISMINEKSNTIFLSMN